MKNTIFLTMIMILPVIALLIGCGKSSNSSLTGSMKEDSDLDFYGICDSILFDEESRTLPAEITDENFIGYYAYSGSSSVEKIYLIRNEDGVLKAYARTFNSGKAKTYKSENLSNEKIFEALSQLSVQDDALNNADGAENTYAYIYYTESGKTYRCMTENILAGK